MLYCIDNLIFFGGIALTTYLHKIAPPEDLKPTLSMGVTMNHFAAVAAPLAAGLVWRYFGYQVIFFSGAVLALISLLVSRGWIPRVCCGGSAKRSHWRIDAQTIVQPRGKRLLIRIWRAG